MLRILSLFFLAAICFASLLNAREVMAQDYTELTREFDAGELTHADRRFLQAALAFEGHYKGLLDGDWGSLSQRAMERYSWREFGESTQDWHMAVLAFSYFEKIVKDGWSINFNEALGLSFLYPFEAVEMDETSEFFVNWRHTNSSLSYSVGINEQSATEKFHEYTASTHRNATPLYTVRKPNFAVTAAKDSTGALLYTRSNFVQGKWSTIMLSANGSDEVLLSAVSSSITVGEAAPVIFTDGGRLHQAIIQLSNLVEEQDEEEIQKGVGQAVAKPEEKRGGSGTGFFVSDKGYVLTNSHVIADCREIEVDGFSARLIDQSDIFDLALLKADYGEEYTIASFASGPAKLNSDVTVVGYPYAGLLGGMNVTRGSISSLKGLAGDATQMQISAPVQPGNSGGPVIGADGAVVGVVVSKLDAKRVADITGDIPQNVNFAVRGEIAKLYLSQNGVDPVVNGNHTRLPPIELAEAARGFTVFIECTQ